MEDRTLMMIRDRGHALTIDIDSLEKDNVVVNYFVPKICNKEMVKALPGINPSSITKNGAVGTFDLKKVILKKYLILLVKFLQIWICQKLEYNITIRQFLKKKIT